MTDSSDPTEKPSAARIYDYLLGGHHNFAADRMAAEHMMKVNPDIALVARANRAFLRRCVTWMTQQGISQFLDIGSGIPTVSNVHAVARRINPAVRVVYVDSDPVAVQYSQEILKDETMAAAIGADAREPESILRNPEVQRIIDFDQPIGVLLVALLHFIADDAQAKHTVQTLREAVAPGSYIAISHITLDNAAPDIVEQFRALYARSSNPLAYRSNHEIAQFFDQLELVEPGLVSIPRWRPDSPNDALYDQPERSMGIAGVGKKA